LHLAILDYVLQSKGIYSFEQFSKQFFEEGTTMTGPGVTIVMLLIFCLLAGLRRSLICFIFAAQCYLAAYIYR